MKLHVFLRWPLLHFFLLGGAVYAARPYLPEAWGLQESREIIVITQLDLATLDRDWHREMGRAPTPREQQASLKRFIEEAVLLREALHLGLDRHDPIVLRQLLKNMHFVYPNIADDQKLLAQAQTLNMAQTDIVCRRRLIQAMEYRLISDRQPLTQAELRAYVEQHPERYAQRARYDFRQVYFKKDRSGTAAERAQQALEQLRHRPAQDMDVPGDMFLRGQSFEGVSAEDISGIFGPAFTRELEKTALKSWSGPITSPYGLHLVYVERRMQQQPADLNAVMTQAAYALNAERIQQLTQDKLDQLKKHYRVVIENSHGVPS